MKTVIEALNRISNKYYPDHSNYAYNAGYYFNFDKRFCVSVYREWFQYYVRIELYLDGHKPWFDNKSHVKVIKLDKQEGKTLFNKLKEDYSLRLKKRDEKIQKAHDEVIDKFLELVKEV